MSLNALVCNTACLHPSLSVGFRTGLGPTSAPGWDLFYELFVRSLVLALLHKSWGYESTRIGLAFNQTQLL